ncbi:hypothetical protein Xentx_01924 [Xenorhabdus thuongxuanensis]|uniref:Uncharacterized protein n=1 Tax=Xenorhabdus thuongxuanensis TaxID=1873484 RepID=A0A1Q5U2V2_9GAMM|nr:hypothetical protein Xentx_01924 [Xenorhabdus thuongxuanensis]
MNDKGEVILYVLPLSRKIVKFIYQFLFLNSKFMYKVVLDGIRLPLKEEYLSY